MDYFYNFEPDAEYLLKRVRVGKKYGVIVDFSNAHGLFFGVVFPNVRGSSGRSGVLNIEWLDPDEVDIL